MINDRPSNPTPFTPTVASLRKLTAKVAVSEENAEIYEHLDNAFKDVKLMIDGKKKGKTLDELIYELRNSNN